MKLHRIFAVILMLVLVITAIPVAVSSAGSSTVVYLADGGRGDGSSPKTPVGSLPAALNALDLSKNCTVVLCGPFRQSATHSYPSEFTGSVTITSVYGGVDYKEWGAEYIADPTRFICTGEYRFTNLDFRIIGAYFLIVANHYPITIDTGVTIKSDNTSFDGKSFATAFGIIGGYQNNQRTVEEGAMPPTRSSKPTNITVNSGRNFVIAAYSRQINDADYSGKATINVGGTASVGALFYAPVNGTYSDKGNVEINVSGSAYIDRMLAERAGAINSFVLNWYSGDINELVLSKDFTVNNGYVLNYWEAASKTSNFAWIKTLFNKVNLVADGTLPPLSQPSGTDPSENNPVTPPPAPGLPDIGFTDKFPIVNTFSWNTFRDIKADSGWFVSDVATAYSIGLMNGMETNLFGFDGTVSVAQAIVMATRINAIFTGVTPPVNATMGDAFAFNFVWYYHYVTYAIKKDIIGVNQFDDYDVPITRADMAAIFAKALPENEYTPINNITKIPDVAATSPYAAAIFKLYNAGIVTGSDSARSYNPNSNIKRSEAAAIINRIAIPANRKTIS